MVDEMTWDEFPSGSSTFSQLFSLATVQRHLSGKASALGQTVVGPYVESIPFYPNLKKKQHNLFTKNIIFIQRISRLLS
jgi:hypothetical protein